jgi:hypothetical protein
MNYENTTQNTENLARRTPLKTRNKRRCSGRVLRSCSTSSTRRVTLVIHLVIEDQVHNQPLVMLPLNVNFKVYVRYLRLETSRVPRNVYC